MKKRSFKYLALATGLFALSAGFLINHNLEKHYRPGDYVPEEDAYFVEYVDDPAGLVKAHKFETPSDNKYSSQKTRSLGSGLIGNIENVWNSYKGAGTTIAVIDDGFDYEHPEFKRSNDTSAILSTSRYYYASGSRAYYKEYSSDPTCIGEDWESDGQGGYEWATHGTNTASTAAAPMGNKGGVGIAPEADILALKIDFSFVAIKAAIGYAIEQNVDVINMSLGAYAESFTDGWGESQSGSSSTSTYLNAICQEAYEAGIIVVAAAGNESTWHKSYPACNTKVIGVGALGDWDNKGNATELAEFTNYVKSSQTGEINVDILAPGYVYTATRAGSKSSPTHTYSDTQGTSFSCPIIAGAACLWKSKYPNGTPDEFLTQLQSSADMIGGYANKMIKVSGWDADLADVGPSEITNGRLNVAKLMNADEAFVSLETSSLSLVKSSTRTVPISASNGTLSYSSNNTNVVTVDSDGLITAVNAGTATITVTATKGSTHDSATLTVTVTAPVNVTSITLNPNSVSLEVGATYNIAPTLSYTPSNATNEFMYGSNDESIAVVDIETGVLTGVKAGTTTITVYPSYGSCEGTLTVTVTPSTAKVWKRVESTSDLQNGDEIVLGTYSAKNVSGQLSGTYLAAVSATFYSEKQINNLPDGVETFTVGKSSSQYTFTQKSNGEQLGFNTTSLVSGAGTRTWTVAISSGIASITSGSYQLAYNTGSPRWKTYASTFSGGDYSVFKKSNAEASSDVSVTGVSVSPSSLSLTVGNSSTLSATVSPGDATNKAVSWSSSNTSVATVSNGTVTAVGAGSATITVTTQDGGKTATCNVTVTNPTVAVIGVTLNKSQTSIAVDGTETLTATVAPSNATNKSVSWSTSAPSIVSVTSAGKITGLAAGSATITVTTVDGGFTATCAVTVTGSGGGGSETPTSIAYTFTSNTWTATPANWVNGKSATNFEDENSQNKRGVQVHKNDAGAYATSPISYNKITNITVNVCKAKDATGSMHLYVGTTEVGTKSSFNQSLSNWSCNVSNLSGTVKLSIDPTNKSLYVKSITISYTTSSGGDTPAETTLSSIAVSTAPTKTSYEEGEYFNPTGLVITRNYSNSTSDTYAYAGHTSEFTFSPTTSTALTTSHTSVTITFGGKSTTQSITVTASSVTPTPTGESYEIVFKTGSGDGTSLSTSTTKSNYIKSGGDYVSGISSVTRGYYAGSDGLKLGTSSDPGTLSLNLAETYDVATIVVSAKRYNSSKSVTLSVNGSTGQSLGTSFSDYEYSINDTVSTLTISSSKYCWVEGITINLADDEGKVVSSLVASYTGSNPFVGESLDESKVNVTAKFTDPDNYPDAVLKSSDYALSGFTSETAGSKTVTVTYIGPLETATNSVSTTFSVTVIEDTLQSISVLSSMETAHPGDIITKSHLTVTATYLSGHTANITDFTFADYQFTYSDAPSGGAVQNKEFTINYGGKSDTFAIAVSREAYAAPDSYSMEMTGTQAGSVITIGNASAATDYTNININGIVCDAHHIYVYNSSGKFMSFGTGAGDIYNVEPLESAITNITLSHRGGSRTDEKLYVSEDGSNWVLKSAADFTNKNYTYFKVEFDAGDGSTYSNFSKINLSLRGLETPQTLANYVMFEDTNQQCTTKFDVAAGYFKNMSADDRATFMTDNSYVIATARERLLAWAAHEGKTIDYVNNDYVVAPSRGLSPMFGSGVITTGTIIAIVATLVSFTAFGAYLVIRKRKEQ